MSAVQWPGPVRALWLARGLLLLLLLCQQHVECKKMEFPDKVTEYKDAGPPGFERARTDEDMAPLYRDNLDADFAPWRAAIEHGEPLSVGHILRQVIYMLRAGLPPKAAHTCLVAVRRGRMHVAYLSRDASELATSRVEAMRQGLEQAAREAGVVLPGSLFLLSLWDESWCERMLVPPTPGNATKREAGTATAAAAAKAGTGAGEDPGADGKAQIAPTAAGVAVATAPQSAEPAGPHPDPVVRRRLQGVGGRRTSSSSSSSSRRGSSAVGSVRASGVGGSGGGGAVASSRPLSCIVPPFSLIKDWDYATNASSNYDVLLPFFKHVYGTLTYYPWEKKVNKALMRASMQSNMGPNSTRLHIIKLQNTDPEGKRLLDAGITRDKLGNRAGTDLADYVRMRDHARWRYLLSADGFTASCRLGKLLGTNSVVVKETTPWIEYYYRSLKPGVHFEPFTRDTVLQAIQGLEANRSRCDALVDAAQHFAYTYLGNVSKALYVRQALLSYNALFEDMGELMEQLDFGGGGGGGAGGGEGNVSLGSLLQQIKNFVVGRQGGASSAPSQVQQRGKQQKVQKQQKQQREKKKQQQGGVSGRVRQQSGQRVRPRRQSGQEQLDSLIQQLEEE